MDVSIQEVDGRLYLVSPYDRECIRDLKAIGGRWDPARKAWSFDPRDKTRVEGIAGRYFGYRADASGETVTIRFKASDHDKYGVIMFANRTIARRAGRDAPVDMAEGAVVVEGRWKHSGGSRTNPDVGETSGIVIELRDIPVEMLETEPDDSYEVVDGDPLKALREERDRLMERIQEIDRQLRGKEEAK